MTIILPASTNPYNNVEFLELRLGDLDARLLTNSGCCNFTLNSLSLLLLSLLCFSIPTLTPFFSISSSSPVSFSTSLFSYAPLPLLPPSLPPSLSPHSLPFLLSLLCLFCFYFLLPSSCLSHTARLDLEGSLQLIVHTASKYDECEIFNFPLAHSSLLCKWNCGGRDPNNHHAVVRCAPDKLPVRHDKQVN